MEAGSTRYILLEALFLSGSLAYMQAAFLYNKFVELEFAHVFILLNFKNENI